MSDLPKVTQCPRRDENLSPGTVLLDHAPAFTPSSLGAWVPPAYPAGSPCRGPGPDSQGLGKLWVCRACLHSGSPGSGTRFPTVHGEAVPAGLPPPQDAELLREDGAAAARRAAAAFRRVQHIRVQAASPDPHARGGPQHPPRPTGPGSWGEALPPPGPRGSCAQPLECSYVLEHLSLCSPG